jgi:OPT family oligopeptide transporter
MTGGGNMAAVPALLVLTGTRPDTVMLMMWFAVIAALGVFAAIPVKRQLINIEQLPFPTGTATAETLKSLHAHGEESGKGKLLLVSSLVGGVISWLRDAKAAWMPFNLPDILPVVPLSFKGIAAKSWSLALKPSFIMMGAGALLGIRTGFSVLIGAVVNYAVLAPMMYGRGAIAEAKYKVIVQWSLWPAAAILVSSGLLAFAFQWKSIGKTFASLGAAFRKSKSADPMVDIECPAWWFPAGFLLLGPVVVWLMWRLFAIPWWAGLLALPMAAMMAFVAARVTGETDVTPTKALGPVTQLVFGILVPRQIPANVMGANVTGGIGLHAADLLMDLKSGFLLGANPRQQFYAQLLGVVAGAAVVVPAFNLLVPDASVIGSDRFPAPSVQVWAGVSRALTGGLEGLHPTARIAAMVGFGLGIVLTVLERVVPKKARDFVPAASGIGIGMMVPGYDGLAIFIGAAVAEVLRRRKAANHDNLTVPVASGLIAGESLIGVLVAMLVAFGILSK